MKLTSQVIITKPYSGKSKFEFWSDLKNGDVVSFSIEMRPIGGGKRKYATTVELISSSFDGKKNRFSCSIDECCNYLSKIGYEE